MTGTAKELLSLFLAKAENGALTAKDAKELTGPIRELLEENGWLLDAAKHAEGQAGDVDNERDAIAAYLETIHAGAIEGTDHALEKQNEGAALKHTAVAKALRDAIRWVRSRQS